MIIRYFTLAMMIVSVSAAYTMQPTDSTKPTWKPKAGTVENNNNRQNGNQLRDVPHQRPAQPRAAIDPAALNGLRLRRGQLNFDDNNIQW